MPDSASTRPHRRRIALPHRLHSAPFAASARGPYASRGPIIDTDTRHREPLGPRLATLALVLAAAVPGFPLGQGSRFWSLAPESLRPCSDQPPASPAQQRPSQLLQDPSLRSKLGLVSLRARHARHAGDVCATEDLMCRLSNVSETMMPSSQLSVGPSTIAPRHPTACEKRADWGHRQNDRSRCPWPGPDTFNFPAVSPESRTTG